MRLIGSLVLAGTLLVLAPHVARADLIGDAHALCDALMASGSTECEVRAWKKVVDATIPTNPKQARDMCAGIAGMMASRGTFAGQGWKMRISAHDGDRPIAVCALR